MQVLVCFDAGTCYVAQAHPKLWIFQSQILMDCLLSCGTILRKSKMVGSNVKNINFLSFELRNTEIFMCALVQYLVWILKVRPGERSLEGGMGPTWSGWSAGVGEAPRAILPF